MRFALCAVFTAFYVVIFSLYAVLLLLCAVANLSVGGAFFHFARKLMLYAVPFSRRAFFPLYEVLFVLCAVVNSLYAMLFLLYAVAHSLYAVLFSLYSRDVVLARFETRPTTQGSQNSGHHSYS